MREMLFGFGNVAGGFGASEFGPDGAGESSGGDVCRAACFTENFAVGVFQGIFQFEVDEVH